MKFKYISILLCLTLVSGCSTQLLGSEEFSSTNQSITEETSSKVPETVESEPEEPLGPSPSEEEISSLLSEVAISKISIFESFDHSGYNIYVKANNPTPLVLEEYNVNAWNIIDKVYSGINTTDVNELTVFVSAENVATYIV